MMTRFDYIDKLRGFAKLLVVIGHIYLPYTKEGRHHPFLGDLFDTCLYPSERILYRMGHD